MLKKSDCCFPRTKSDEVKGEDSYGGVGLHHRDISLDGGLVERGHVAVHQRGSRPSQKSRSGTDPARTGITSTCIT